MPDRYAKCELANGLGFPRATRLQIWHEASRADAATASCRCAITHLSSSPTRARQRHCRSAHDRLRVNRAIRGDTLMSSHPRHSPSAPRWTRAVAVSRLPRSPTNREDIMRERQNAALDTPRRKSEPKRASPFRLALFGLLFFPF